MDTTKEKLKRVIYPTQRVTMIFLNCEAAKKPR